MVAGIVHLCGAWGGKMSGATRHNRKGMFENSHIRQNIVKGWLRKHGYDPLCQNPLPPRVVEPVPGWRDRVLKAIEAQGYNGGGPWMYKGAKMVCMWQIWHHAFPHSKWIFVERDYGGIAKSCLRTGFMRAYRTKEEWMEWAREHVVRMRRMKIEGIDVTCISAHEIVAGDFSNIRAFIERCGLTWNRKAVRDFVDPGLYGGRK
jgi:hypothetical protein